MEQEERMYQVPLEMICRHDRTAEVCRAAVEEDGWQLENVPEEMKTPELCRKALETEAERLPPGAGSAYPFCGGVHGGAEGVPGE